MVSVIVPSETSLKKRMERFKWIKWSEIGREAAHHPILLAHRYKSILADTLKPYNIMII